SHLETSSGGMVEDLMEKTAIIEHYIMNGRIDQVHHSPSHDNKLRLKNVVDFVKNKTDDSTKELNKKLQKMLEETLTKNIHLQQDVEHLSQKLMEASQSSSVVSVSSPEHPSASTPQ
ncbi:PREDICTED: GRIP1-associated protein 1-like, partial [Priapulus caudatus]|uniref:GRIP1-associated protein 1-like n=1 Tax=Priapulus caudatus TaxID=37621 RepID=A0ABM1EKP9_PRICU